MAYENDRNYHDPFRPVLTDIPVHYAGKAGTEEGIRILAGQIAGDMISAARASGHAATAWVTGNSYLPALRSYPQAELVWQASYPSDADGRYPSNTALGYWDTLDAKVERLLDAASVYLGSPEDDNSLYVVDLRRFEARDDYDDAENLQDEWVPVSEAG
jgi:hypothetical protein